MLSAYLAAAGVLAMLVVLPGPDFAVVSRFSMSQGREAGLRAAAGVGLGLVAWGSMTVIGLAAILTASAEAFTALRILGCLYLVFMGARLLLSRGSASGGDGFSGSPALVGTSTPLWCGASTNLLNPKIGIFYTAVLPSLVPHVGSTPLWLCILVATHAALTLVWLSVCASLLAASSKLARPVFMRLIDRITGVVLIGLGVRVALASR